MKNMSEYAKAFQTKYINQGVVSKITDYSFEYAENPKTKDGQPKIFVYMISYFWEYNQV